MASSFAPTQEPALYAGAVSAVIDLAAYVFAWKPELVAVVTATATTVLAVLVRQNVTPKAKASAPTPSS